MPDLLERLRAALADRYRIERELGSGGMAIVFLAEDLKHRRKVALKVLRAELAAGQGSRYRPRTVPSYQNFRFSFLVRGNTLYTSLADRQSDVWLAEVRPQ